MCKTESHLKQVFKIQEHYSFEAKVIDEITNIYFFNSYQR